MVLAAVAVLSITFSAGLLVGVTIRPGDHATASASAGGLYPNSSPSPRYEYLDMNVGFIGAGFSGWFAANTSSFKEEAVQRGITFTYVDSQNSFDKQISALKAFIADPKINVIVLAPSESLGYEAELRAARAAGKVVVLEGSRLDADAGLYYTYVGPDYVSQGQKAAAAMCDALKDSKSKNVVEITGNPGDLSTIDRSKGFRLGMGDCGISILDSGAAVDSDPGAAQAIMKGFLKAHPGQFQGVVLQADLMTASVVGAIDGSGLKSGKNVQLVSFDLMPEGVRYLITGQLHADVDSTPLLAPLAYDAALRGLNGDSTTPKSISPNDEVYYTGHLPECLLGCPKY
jgi:ABC-type sugar transport system substrate-binding protein